MLKAHVVREKLGNPALEKKILIKNFFSLSISVISAHNRIETCRNSAH